jgi:hypothetical protein
MLLLIRCCGGDEMRGIEIITKREFAPKALSLLLDMDIDKYIWHMPDKQIINYETDPTFANQIKSGYDIKNIIEAVEKREMLVILINLRAFLIGSAITEPQDYNEFLKSKCFLVYLVYDCDYIEIYCKDDGYLDTVYNKYKDHPDIKSIKYKTDQNDGRYTLYV